jgi:hypothetical protein
MPKQTPTRLFTKLRHREGARAVALVLVFAIVLGVGLDHMAFAYAGEQLLEFARNYVIAPLGIFALVVALAASFFRPDLVKGAIYAVVICAVLFFVISQARSLMTALQS